jgi:hypothetical protein
MRTPWKRKHWSNTLLESTPSWRRVIEPKIITWRSFLFGGWINPNVTHVHPCIVECSMWGCLVGYLYGHVSLFYVSLPRLLVYMREERAPVCIHYYRTLLCTCLVNVKFHEETIGARC